MIRRWAMWLVVIGCVAFALGGGCDKGSHPSWDQRIDLLEKEIRRSQTQPLSSPSAGAASRPAMQKDPS